MTNYKKNSILSISWFHFGFGSWFLSLHSVCFVPLLFSISIFGFLDEEYWAFLAFCLAFVWTPSYYNIVVLSFGWVGSPLVVSAHHCCNFFSFLLWLGLFWQPLVFYFLFLGFLQMHGAWISKLFKFQNCKKRIQPSGDLICNSNSGIIQISHQSMLEVCKNNISANLQNNLEKMFTIRIIPISIMGKIVRKVRTFVYGTIMILAKNSKK